ncbi:MAG: UDP-N-acetylmuramate--L-alanine ligase [Dehalococcoidia bacterium]|nr:UDP-N-acetylmuramate--L-alanine ligase [Dehalococcoidia bacterium]
MAMAMPHSIPGRVHLVGVGGAHMSAIARILLQRGHAVSGSDLRPGPVTEGLAELGLSFRAGHDAANVGDAELVVHTVAAKPDNPELAAARSAGLPVLTRAQMVARLLAGLRLVAVAGSHGKTTTSSLVAHLLKESGMYPTYMLGGESRNLGSNAGSGDGEWAVVEADEYGRAFLEYEPDIAVVTNIEPDHLDYYGDYQAVKDAFRQFLERVKADGLVIAATASQGLDEVLTAARPPARILRYGANGVSTWKGYKLTYDDGLQRFYLLGEGRDYGVFQLAVPGRHNFWNAVGALAAAIHAGADVESLRRALPRFSGARRRFESVGEARGISILDDYAHHPTEIKATIEAARARFPGRRLVIVFQPHTYSRTGYLFEEFKGCFEGADGLFVLDTYAARESGGEGPGGRELAEAIAQPPASFIATHEEAVDVLEASLTDGDVVFTMGAGDVDRVGPALLARLESGQ